MVLSADAVWSWSLSSWTILVRLAGGGTDVSFRPVRLLSWFVAGSPEVASRFLFRPVGLDPDALVDGAAAVRPDSRPFDATGPGPRYVDGLDPDGPDDDEGASCRDEDDDPAPIELVGPRVVGAAWAPGEGGGGAKIVSLIS